MDMEDLLCPQISMDVDETPLNLDIGSPEKDEDSGADTAEIPMDIRIKLLLELESFDAAQTPEPLTVEEEALKQTLFSVGPSVQFMKLHCTSCNSHLGSAPINHFDRFIHPLLHVMLCKSCYEFSCSGEEFEKDEDGSEMYCRWCGQGGNVMCCSDCAYVFCQKCVRQNLGQKALSAIKNSDDWKCFSCNPKQLINLKLICHSLYKFVENEISAAKETNNVENLKKDHSLCCNKLTTKPRKRKRSNSSEDAPYDPWGGPPEPKKKKQSVSVLKKVLSSFQAPATVNSTNPPPLWKIRNSSTPFLKVRNISGPNNFRPIQPKNPTKLMTTTGSLHKVNVPGTQNYIPMNSQVMLIKNSAQPQAGQPHKQMVNALPATLTPGMKHRWFDQASSITNNITGNLNRRLAGFTIEQRNATTIEQLANIHNKLQELLSSSVNSLIQVRKNLRNEFLTDLNKIKVANKIYTATTVRQGEHRCPNHSNSSKDDDVIIINNDEEDPLAISTPSTNAERHDGVSPRPYLKLKPVSSLMDRGRLPLSNEQANGIPEQIDLCDDDDEDETRINHDDQNKPQISNDVMLIEDEINENPAKKEALFQSVPPTKDDDDGTALPDVDSDTYLQIRRALAESKFELALQENLTVKVNGSIPQNVAAEMLSVRVNVIQNFGKKIKVLKTPETPHNKPAEPMIVDDFEEMLSGTLVPNVAKNITNDVVYLDEMTGDVCPTGTTGDSSKSANDPINSIDLTSGDSDIESDDPLGNNDESHQTTNDTSQTVTDNGCGNDFSKDMQMEVANENGGEKDDCIELDITCENNEKTIFENQSDGESPIEGTRSEKSRSTKNRNDEDTSNKNTDRIENDENNKEGDEMPKNVHSTSNGEEITSETLSDKETVTDKTADTDIDNTENETPKNVCNNSNGENNECEIASDDKTITDKKIINSPGREGISNSNDGCDDEEANAFLNFPDKVTEEECNFDASTDPVTTTDSGIEVDAK